MIANKICRLVPLGLAAGLILVAIAGCFSGSGNEEVKPTRNLQATIDAAVKAAVPTKTPTPQPTDTPAPPTPDIPATVAAALAAIQPTPAAPTNTPIPPTATPNTPPVPQLEPTPSPSPTPTGTPQPTRQPSPLDDLRGGARLERKHPERAAQIRVLPWVADGIAEDERIAVAALIECGQSSPTAFDVLIANPETKDSVNNTTGQALGRLCDLEILFPDIWEDFMGKGWVQDGLTENESEIVQGLYSMIFDSLDHRESHRIWAAMISMPFLETVDRFDYLAVRALAQIDNGLGVGERFAENMSHPIFHDGISDQEAKMLALLYGIYDSNSDKAVSLLLEPGGASLDIEERVIELPLAGEVKLTIFRRYRHRNAPTMDLLEHSVRANEEFMGAPFPDNWVVLYFHTDNSGQLSRHGGTYSGIHMELRRDYDVEHGERTETALHVLLHETGHYYWRSSPGWISEGGANFLEYISNPERRGREFAINEYAVCDGVTTLSQLEKLRPLPGDKLYKCNYQLGEGIFLELYHTLGEELFRDAFRSLYLKRSADDLANNCEGTPLSICHLAAAFKAGVSDDVVAKVDEIIARRYGPVP